MLCDAAVLFGTDRHGARINADLGQRGADRDRRGENAVSAQGRDDLVLTWEPGVHGDLGERRPVEHDVGNDAPDDAVARHHGDRPLNRPSASRLAARADEELQVAVFATQPRQRRMVAIPQGALHPPQRRELNRVKLSVVDDAAVLAHGGAERRYEPSVRLVALVRGRVVAESPRRGPERQDQQQERPGEAQPQPERTRCVVCAVDPNR